jgi:hypothetical protein
MSARWAGVVMASATLLTSTGCAVTATTAMPRCEASQRLGIVAQSAPGAAYLPCIAELPPGWSFESFDVDDDGTRFSLRSDRSDLPVDVELAATCDVGTASPVTPRDEGVRTYLLTESVSPRYAGRFYDVFVNGCITYEFDFTRGPHIALIDELQRAVQLYPRRLLRQELRGELGITLDP